MVPYYYWQHNHSTPHTYLQLFPLSLRLLGLKILDCEFPELSKNWSTAPSKPPKPYHKTCISGESTDHTMGLVYRTDTTHGTPFDENSTSHQATQCGTIGKPRRVQ
eukprot:scaffold1918_cov154-Amphora_coffeaeformis.AAC.11